MKKPLADAWLSFRVDLLAGMNDLEVERLRDAFYCGACVASSAYTIQGDDPTPEEQARVDAIDEELLVYESFVNARATSKAH